MRRRILVLVVGMTTLVVLAFAAPLAVLIRTAVMQRAENAATDQANNVAASLRSGVQARATIADYVESLSERTGRTTWVVLDDGTVLGEPPEDEREHEDGHSDERDEHRVPPDGNAPPAPAQLRGVPGGQIAESAVTVAGTVYRVRVYVSNGDLHAGEGKWWLLLAAGSAGLLLIAVLAAELFTRRIVRPLTHTADTAQRLAAGDTTARAPTDGPPEIAEVGTSLNRLADRIDELIAEERETVADLSHRLRTPLTALRLDAEALRNPAEAERIGAHVSTLERMLTAVIRAARRPQREGRIPSCDATTVVGERVRFWSALVEDQDRASTIDLPPQPLLVRAAGEDLAAAVDALLENVVAHTPEGTAFTVRLAATEGGARLDIADEGPGLPEDADVRGRSDRGSSGLGLDIARRCAEGSGGSMSLGRSPTGGARVTMLLKAP